MSNNKNKPDGKSSKNKILIWVAIIGLAGTLGAAVITSWDKVFPKNHINNELPVNTEDKPPVISKSEIKKVAYYWWSAVLIGDIETIVNLSSEQFTFTDITFSTKTEFRIWLNEQMSEDQADDAQIDINSLIVYSIPELRSKNKEDYNFVKSLQLNLTINDYAIVDSEDIFGLLIARQNKDDVEIIAMVAY